MAKVKIEGGGLIDGSYDLDLGVFTNRELHIIKKETGVRAGELQDAFVAGDNDILVVLAHIASVRAGKDIPMDVLWAMEAGGITFDLTDEEVEEDSPPESRPDSDESVSGPTEPS